MVANTPVAVPKNALVPETNAVDAVETATVLPVDFQGRWGLVANDCDPARDDNKGLMTVAADTLKFYESRGVVKTVPIASPPTHTPDLAFTAEGPTLTHIDTSTLLHGGKPLSRWAGKASWEEK